jgi:hypothetical protein
MSGFTHTGKLLPSAPAVQQLLCHALLNVPYFWQEISDQRSPLAVFADFGMLYTRTDLSGAVDDEPPPLTNEALNPHVLRQSGEKSVLASVRTPAPAVAVKPRPLFLYVPTFLLHWWSMFYENVYMLALVAQLCRFPPASVRESSRWTTFPFMYFGTLVVKLSSAALINHSPLRIGDLFPGVGPSELMEDTVVPKPIYLVKEERFWLTRVPNRSDLHTTTHDEVPVFNQLHNVKWQAKVSEGRHLLMSADNALDVHARMVFDRPESTGSSSTTSVTSSGNSAAASAATTTSATKKPYLFLFQLHTSGGSTVQRKVAVEAFRRRTDAIQRAYSLNRYMVVGVIVFGGAHSGYGNTQDLNDYIMAQKNLIMMSSRDVQKMAPGFAHRLANAETVEAFTTAI